MLDNKLFLKYRGTLERNSNKIQARSNIKQYLEWRGITIEELIESGLQEQEYFDKLLKDKSLRLKEKSRITRILIVKRFMRFHGVPFKKYDKYQATWFYENDPAMKEFLDWCGEKKGTKKNANRFLNHYCIFRGKSPSELVQEANTLSKKRIGYFLKTFHDSLTIKTRPQVVAYVRKFYEDVAEKEVKMPSAIKPYPKKEKKYDLKKVDKAIVKQMLEGADIRDGMIILACFDSPQNPIDLVKLDYEDLKDYLDLENPESINDVAVIPMKREKTGKDGLYSFGPLTLKYISKWLKYMQTILKEWNVQITDDFPIFTMKKAPYERLKEFNISATLKKICRKVNLEKQYTSGDFRDSWNTRVKPLMTHYDKELFMGHVGGIEGHYDISNLDYFINEYRKVWKELFDLTYDEIKVRDLELDYKDIKRTLQDVSTVLEKMFSALYDPAWDTNIYREDLERALKKLREID